MLALLDNAGSDVPLIGRFECLLVVVVVAVVVVNFCSVAAAADVVVVGTVSVVDAAIEI